jgi:multicomponent Na+:H+ antiporter subunit D
MSMGAVLFRTGTIKGSELGGLYKSMPWTAGLCVVGAASISAFPLFSAFVTKSMILLSAAEQGYVGVWLVLLFASAGVFHHAGIKIPYFAFFAHDSGIRCKEAPRHMLLAMGLAAAFCIGIGVFPDALYRLLPYPVQYAPYTASHVLAQLQLLVLSAVAFSFLKWTGIYPPELRSVNLDSDWVYRRAAPALVHGATTWWAFVSARLGDTSRALLRRIGRTVERWCGVDGVLARTWSTSAMTVWVAALLAAYLLARYL